MKLQEILRDSQYKLNLFSQESIKRLESAKRRDFTAIFKPCVK